VLPGSTKLIELDAPEGGYVLYCVPHTQDPDTPTSEDMAATMRVR
jgi:hypothetical protein